MSEYGVILFHTSSAAFRAEKVLTEAGLAFKLIPIPREFSSDCGVALRFEWNRLNDITDVLEAEAVETESVHEMPELVES